LILRPGFLIGLLAFSAFASVGWQVQRVKPIVNPTIRDENIDVGEDSSTVSLLGQFRTTASAWLWLRADSYLHNGVEMRPLSETEAKKGITVDNAKDDGNERLHAENEITAVPSKDRDFRGIFGDVERRVASYKDMHNHTHNDPVVAMPLYRLMTWLDPQFVQGWTIGGMILARDHSGDGTARSLAFLREGWAANPKCVDIPSQIGYTIYSRHGDISESIRYLEIARGNGMQRLNVMDEQERDALRTTYHFLAMAYRDAHRADMEQATLLEGMKVFRDDNLMPLIWKRQGF